MEVRLPSARGPRRTTSACAALAAILIGATGSTPAGAAATTTRTPARAAATRMSARATTTRTSARAATTRMSARPATTRTPASSVATSLSLAARTTATIRTPAGTAAVGQVEGHVHLVTSSTRRLASAGAYPGRTVGLAADRRPSELANVIVFVKAKPTVSTPGRASIRQQDEEFIPHVVAVTAGSTVDFPNDDIVFHNVFSLSRAGEFDLGRYPKGRAKARVFARPGLVKVFCHLHSQMSALIRVFDHPYFTIPNGDGDFVIPDVPAGDYDVVAWHERVGEVTLHATVSATRSATLTFSLPLADEP